MAGRQEPSVSEHPAQPEAKSGDRIASRQLIPDSEIEIVNRPPGLLVPVAGNAERNLIPRLLAKDPGQRPQDARAVLERL